MIVAENEGRSSSAYPFVVGFLALFVNIVMRFGRKGAVGLWAKSEIGKAKTLPS